MSKLPRMLICFDGENVFQREIINITHDANSGEAIYHTKPTQWFQKRADKFIRLIKRRKYDRRFANKLKKYGN